MYRLDDYILWSRIILVLVFCFVTRTKLSRTQMSVKQQQNSKKNQNNKHAYGPNIF